jgi:hypothetical protein
MVRCALRNMNAACCASLLIGGAAKMYSLQIFASRSIGQPLSRRRLILCLAAASCLDALRGAGAEARPRPLPGVRWSKLVQSEEGKVALYHVMLERRLKVFELDTLSRELTRDAPKNQLSTILCFLRGMDPAKAPWAISNFNPSLGAFEIRIDEAVTQVNPPDEDLQREAGR